MASSRVIPLNEVTYENLPRLQRELEDELHFIIAATNKESLVRDIIKKVREITKTEIKIEKEVALLEHKIHVSLRNEYYLAEKLKTERDREKREVYSGMLNKEKRQTVELVYQYCIEVTKELDISEKKKMMLREEFEKIRMTAAAERGIKV